MLDNQDAIVIDDSDELVDHAVCTSCDATIDTSDDDSFVATSDIAMHCIDCVFFCEYCNDFKPNDNRSERFDGHIICDSCDEDVTECDRCSALEQDYNTRYIYDDYGHVDCVWCEDCTNRYGYFCDVCDEYHDGHSCRPDSQHGSNIEDYGYKPRPNFHKVENDFDADRFMFMGFELEVEAGRSCQYGGADLVEEKLGDLTYFKTDGSLSDGFEIVSHPMTLAYAQSLDLTVLLELANLGYRSWDTSTCGLHVHIDKRAFTGRKHQYAFTLLLMRNRSLSYLVSGRSGNSYAKFDKDVRSQIPQHIKGKRSMYDRYSAVNVIPNSTIEVRMFRGSLKKERLLSALEYVHSAVEYTRYVKSGSLASEELTAPAFIQWVRANKETYPNLVYYINNSTEFGYRDASPANARNNFDGEEL